MRNSADRPALAYYVSAHGYGHGVRSCYIIDALNAIRPDLQVYIVSDLSESFLRNRLLSDSNSFRAGSFDLGMVQLDSIQVDVPATLKGVEAIYDRRQALIESEAAFLRAQNVSLVVADIPALPLEAAARAGIPRIAVGNFGWDWIYSDFIEQDRRWERIVQEIREGYAQADLLLRLPFSEKMEVFQRIEDVPIVSSAGVARRMQMASLTGARPDRTWILISFTTLDWDDAALDRVERYEDFEFFTVLPLTWPRANIHAIDREKVLFSDVVASVDAVLSKPGFGIVSECLVNGKPLIYADRKNFLEYTILEDAIHKHLRYIHIPTGQLYRGDLNGVLGCLQDLPAPPFSAELGGAAVAARRILEFL